METWVRSLVPITNTTLLIQPEYKEQLDPRSLRRMSSILKMGSYNAVDCLAKVENAKPEAIIVGTGLGCSSDTLSFLNEINTNLNAALSPTAFIRSTHNTVAGQIALLLKIKGYNMTFTQGSLSFESALSDAMMAIRAGEFTSALVGGIDELSDGLRNLLLDLVSSNELERPVLGQGSSFLFVEADGQSEDIEVIGVKSFHNGQSAENVASFLQSTETKVDLILDGSTVIFGKDGPNHELSTLNYKQYCGEYFSASSFGVMLGYAILKTQILPEGVGLKTLKTILVNSGFGNEQGLILLRVK